MASRARKPKLIMFETALKLMRSANTRLMIMHHHSLEGGKGYFIVSGGSNPGGMIEDKEAEKIIARPDVHAAKDGLFPGSTQSWFMGV